LKLVQRHESVPPQLMKATAERSTGDVAEQTSELQLVAPHPAAAETISTVLEPDVVTTPMTAADDDQAGSKSKVCVA